MIHQLIQNSLLFFKKVHQMFFASSGLRDHAAGSMYNFENAKLIVDHLSDHALITDLDGTVLYGNHSVEIVTGFPLKEVIGKTSGRLWSRSIGKETVDQFWKTRAHLKTVYRGEVTNRRKNGKRYKAGLEVLPLKADGATVRYFLCIERDLSKKHHVEEQIIRASKDLEKKREQLESDKLHNQALFSNIGDGIVSTNEDGIIVMVNDSALNLLGLHRSEAVGHPIASVFELVDEQNKPLSEAERPFSIALTTGSKTTVPIGKSYFYKRKDGKRFPVNMTVTPYLLDGQIKGVVEVFRDVTLEKDVDRMKTEFVSLASHQLRTPLSSINWYAEMLLSGDAGQLSDEQKHFVEEIYKGNQRMVDLVNSFLTVSRIEMGTFVVEPEQVDLKVMVRSVLDELKPQIAMKQLSVKTTFDPLLTVLSLDPKLFRIVLQNLLSNAVKYTPENGTVLLTTKKRKKDFLLKVKDSGLGIPQKDQNKIFSKMFRADNAKISDTGGTGLGLYIIKSIIEQTTSGTVWFESVENEGTTFFVSIPHTGMAKLDGSATK